MKNLTIKLSSIVTLGTLLLSFSYTYSQCDTCTYTYEMEKKPFRELEVNPPGSFNDSNYIPCDTNSLRKRNITFIHGLGGNASSWDKAKTWTDLNYETAVVNVNYSGVGWETSFHNVGIEVNSQMFSGIEGGVGQLYPNRCVFDDYAIAHSQGGIAARYIDRQWDLNNSTFGTRKFYGLVTFGTPHAGADIALTRSEHTAYIQRVVSSVYLNPVTGFAYDITSKFGFLIGDKLLDITDSLNSTIKTKLVPVLVVPLHTGTLDEMANGSQTMNNINNHGSKLHKIAFYGIEEAPEVWRVLDGVVGKKAEEYPVFTAGPDGDLILKMDSIRAEHEVQIAKTQKEVDKLIKRKGKWFVGGFVSNKKINSKKAVIDHRQTTVTFLNNANTEWRYLIGSYHRDSFDIDTVSKFIYFVKAEYIKNGNVIDKITRTCQSLSEANVFSSYMQNIGYQTTTTPINIPVISNSFFPSDGVVLAKSQIKFPNIDPADIDKMEGNNHFQERNSPETKILLEKLYDGTKYDPFFKLEKL